MKFDEQKINIRGGPGVLWTWLSPSSKSMAREFGKLHGYFCLRPSGWVERGVSVDGGRRAFFFSGVKPFLAKTSNRLDLDIDRFGVMKSV